MEDTEDSANSCYDDASAEEEQEVEEEEEEGDLDDFLEEDPDSLLQVQLSSYFPGEKHWGKCCFLSSAPLWF